MEAEVRAILADAVREPRGEPGLADAIMQRFSELIVAEIRYGFTGLGEYIYPFDTNAAIAYAQILARSQPLARDRVGVLHSSLNG